MGSWIIFIIGMFWIKIFFFYRFGFKFPDKILCHSLNNFLIYLIHNKSFNGHSALRNVVSRVAPLLSGISIIKTLDLLLEKLRKFWFYFMLLIWLNRWLTTELFTYHLQSRNWCANGLARLCHHSFKSFEPSLTCLNIWKKSRLF